MLQSGQGGTGRKRRASRGEEVALERGDETDSHCSPKGSIDPKGQGSSVVLIRDCCFGCLIKKEKAPVDFMNPITRSPWAFVRSFFAFPHQLLRALPSVLLKSARTRVSK